MSIGTLELQIAIDTAAQWESIGIKSLASSIMQECWPNYGAAAHQLNFYPVPNASIPVALYLLQAIPRFTAITNVVQLPPGYQEPLTFELAMKCSSKFGASIPAWMPAAWSDGKATIRANNFEPIDVACDPALVKPGPATGGGSINFYLGR
jgi:hypothetical protein